MFFHGVLHQKTPDVFFSRQLLHPRVAEQDLKPPRLEPRDFLAERRHREIPPPFVVVGGAAARRLDDQAVAEHAAERPVEVGRQHTRPVLILDLAHQAPAMALALLQSEEDLEHQRFEGKKGAGIGHRASIVVILTSCQSDTI